MTAFKEQDANGNGDPNDEVPLAAAITGWNPNIDGFLLNPFVFSEFAGQNRFFEMNDGVISQNVTSEATAKACATWARSSARACLARRALRSPWDKSSSRWKAATRRPSA